MPKKQKEFFSSLETSINIKNKKNRALIKILEEDDNLCQFSHISAAREVSHTSKLGNEKNFSL